MEETAEAKASNALSRCQYLWEEYKYRHDMIWDRIFRFTGAEVVISTLPYLNPGITRRLEGWILLVPGLSCVLALFVFAVMWNELEVFGKVKNVYRVQQEILFPGMHAPRKKSRFEFVRLYLAVLVILNVANLYMVWNILVKPLCG